MAHRLQLQGMHKDPWATLNVFYRLPSVSAWHFIMWPCHTKLHHDLIQWENWKDMVVLITQSQQYNTHSHKKCYNEVASLHSVRICCFPSWLKVLLLPWFDIWNFNVTKWPRFKDGYICDGIMDLTFINNTGSIYLFHHNPFDRASPSHWLNVFSRESVIWLVIYHDWERNVLLHAHIAILRQEITAIE